MSYNPTNAYRQIQNATSRASKRVSDGVSMWVIHKVNDVRIWMLLIGYDEKTVRDRLLPEIKDGV